MDESQKIIYDLLKDVREDQKKDSKKIHDTAERVAGLEPRVAKIEEETEKNRVGLDKHMSRTEIAEEGLAILKDLHADNQKRIKANEQRIQMLEDDNKKKDKEILDLKTQKQVDESVKTTLKDMKENWKYWLTIASLTVGLITKVLGLW